MSWAYENNTAGIKVFGEAEIIHLNISENANISQVLISEIYNVYVEKELERISFYDLGKNALLTFNKDNFTS
jgi:hypothetical protein